ncbi:hypothetical protein [Streptomyces zingiberis]|uniref:hypothetical protein n=1 Tax=Streptomyces zingiberis TaxID=2053010 RepID=UPI001F0F1F77
MPCACPISGARPERVLPALGGAEQVLAERYASVFSLYDMEELGLLLHVDATLALPPYTKWMRGMADIERG